MNILIIGGTGLISTAITRRCVSCDSDRPSFENSELMCFSTARDDNTRLAAIAADRELSVPDQPVRWLPSHLMLGSFIVSMIFWYALDAREQAGQDAAGSDLEEVRDAECAELLHHFGEPDRGGDLLFQ